MMWIIPANGKSTITYLLGRHLKIEGNDFARVVQVELDKYRMEVGILEDEPKRSAVAGRFKTYAGQQLAVTGKKTDESLVDVAERLDKQFHWLERPFRIPQNQDVQQVVADIAQSINMNHTGKRRVLNGVQAIIRNPILANYYGGNSARTVKIKGFDKLLMWTGQFFQNIRARYVS